MICEKYMQAAAEFFFILKIPLFKTFIYYFDYISPPHFY